jgi:hypothetical protein
MLGELANLHSDVIHVTFDPGLPIFKVRRNALQLVHAHVLNNGEIGDLPFPLVFRLGEPEFPLLL